MAATKFDEIVRARAKRQTDDALDKFAETVATACDQLLEFGRTHNRAQVLTPGMWEGERGALLRVLLSANPHEGWPPFVRHEREKQISQALLRALDAKPKDTILARLDELQSQGADAQDPN